MVVWSMSLWSDVHRLYVWYVNIQISKGSYVCTVDFYMIIALYFRDSDVILKLDEHFD